MRDRCITSCCYSPQNHGYYATYADRLERSLDEYGPNADRIIWRKEWPPGSPPHSTHHYSFKFFAVQDAFEKGYRYALWLDAGCMALAPIEPLWERIKTDGYLLINGTDNLGEWISDKALKRFNVEREIAYSMILPGGCIIGLDREHPKARAFFEVWGELAKTTRLFMGHHTTKETENGVMRSILRSDADNEIISEDPRVKGHRSDEACFGLLARDIGMVPMAYGEWIRYFKTY